MAVGFVDGAAGQPTCPSCFNLSISALPLTSDSLRKASFSASLIGVVLMVFPFALAAFFRCVMVRARLSFMLVPLWMVSSEV